ncbi:hypothetical protein CQW23_15069 [Capsicum baccatum]|uniref:Uncharacterized protein n=1 Tax=Capsicum baccatum TaxID=33114 RepID=A0A2G2WL08_CAPBA|nr:hypothetical protein CQW23_15069 [Capsicum baccatum]
MVPIPPSKWELPRFDGHEPKEELCNGFSVEPLEDVAEKFNKLSQTESVGELLVKFEELKAQMLMRNPNLSESHFLSSFVGALKEEIKYGVKLYKPTTLKLAVEQARL